MHWPLSSWEQTESPYPEYIPICYKRIRFHRINVSVIFFLLQHMYNALYEPDLIHVFCFSTSPTIVNVSVTASVIRKHINTWTFTYLWVMKWLTKNRFHCSSTKAHNGYAKRLGKAWGGGGYFAKISIQSLEIKIRLGVGRLGKSGKGSSVF